MAKNDFQYGGWNSYTLQCGTIMTLISRGGWWLHPAMWHVALRSWQWIQQVAVGLPCNMTRGSGMTCHWIRQVAAPCNVAVGSGMTCHWICPNVRHIRILLLVSISAISPLSTCHSAPVCEILYKSDHPWQKKTRSALGRAHVPPTKVFRRMSRHSRVDYSNAVFAVSGKLVGPYYWYQHGDQKRTTGFLLITASIVSVKCQCMSEHICTANFRLYLKEARTN